MEFQWDSLKDQANIKKHGISFEEASELSQEKHMSDEMQELTRKDLERAITREQRLRLISGEWKSGDLATLRKYLGLSQKQFALRIGISINTLQNWEQGRRNPDGPAKALLRLIAKYPSLVLHDLEEDS